MTSTSLTLAIPATTEKMTHDRALRVVDRIIQRLMAYYGTKFADAYGGMPIADLKAVWAEELASFSMLELERGIAACRTRTWPPTLPEFMVLCRPPLDVESAFHEAARGLRLRARGEAWRFSHPAIFHAAVALGSGEIENTPYPHFKARWATELSRQLERNSWPEIPPPPAGLLPAPAGVKPSPEIAARIAGLERQFTRRNSNPEA